MELEKQRDELRKLWRSVRDRRLSLKLGLVSRGLDIKGIREHREYRNLKKEQARLSVLIKHLEKKINKTGAAHGKEKK